MYGSLFYLSLIALLLGALVAARIWTVRAPVKHVSCGRCRYTVAFTPSDHCSECGADLLRIGVVTPEMGRTPRRPHRTVFAVAVAMVLTAGAALAALAIGSFISSPLHLVERGILVGGPGSGAYLTAEVRLDSHRRVRVLDSHRRGSVASFRAVCFRVEHHDVTWSRQKCFRLADRDFHHEWIFDGSATSSGVLTPTPDDPPGRSFIVKPADVPIEALQQWAGEIGLDVNSPAIRGELEDLIRVATEFFHTEGTTVHNLTHFNPAQFQTFMNVTYDSPPEAGYAALLTGVLVGLGFGGLIVRSVKKEKRLQQVAARDWLASHDS